MCLSISPTHAKSVYLEQWQIEERESKRRKELEHYVSETQRPQHFNALSNCMLLAYVLPIAVVLCNRDHEELCFSCQSHFSVITV